MKKFLTILFTIMYVAASSGASIQLQLCKGKLVNMSLWLEDEGSCDNDCPSSGIQKKDCCKHKQQQLKADDYHSPSVEKLVKPMYQALIPDYPTQLVLTPISSILVEFPKSNGPPVAGKIALYIKNCTFII